MGCLSSYGMHPDRATIMVVLTGVWDYYINNHLLYVYVGQIHIIFPVAWMSQQTAWTSFILDTQPATSYLRT